MNAYNRSLKFDISTYWLIHQRSIPVGSYVFPENFFKMFFLFGGKRSLRKLDDI